MHTPDPQNSGRLFIVATPIGNLSDLSPRASKTLSDVALIACEDTRQTRVLLDHLGIKTPLTAYHDHNEQLRTTSLLETLSDGKDVALVSDAGTPCIADPGYRLVAAARDAGIQVIPIPGPCAAISALSAAGLAVNRWTFLGFPPRTSSARQTLLKAEARPDTTLILYESPQRILDLLDDISAALGEDRIVCVARELTKVFEEFIRGTATEVRSALGERDRVRGECVVLIGPPAQVSEVSEDPQVLERSRALLDVMKGGGCSDRTMRDALVVAFGWRKADAYRFVLGDGVVSR